MIKTKRNKNNRKRNWMWLWVFSDHYKPFKCFHYNSCRKTEKFFFACMTRKQCRQQKQNSAKAWAYKFTLTLIIQSVI